MSKKRNTRQPPRLVQKSIFGGFIRPRSDEAIQRDVMLAVEKADYEYLPPEILAGLTMRDVETHDLGIDENNRLNPRTCSMTQDTFRKFARRAMAAGFVAALVKYRKQLAGVPALERFYGRQKTGQRRGRDVQAQRKASRAVQAMAMAKRGESVAEIVAHFRANGMSTCNRATVYRWLKTPQKAR